MKHKFFILLALLTLCSGQAAAKRKCKQPQIPILAWYSIPPGEFATLERYQELAECGFTYSFSHTYALDDALLTLDLCHKAGIKCVFTCNDLATDPEGIASKIRKHPGLGAYFLRDEPGNDAMPGLGEWARKIEKVDPNHPCYLNLLPVHAMGHEAYVEHLEKFCQIVDLPQLSFDHYPINEAGGDSVYLNPFWYDNLELILQAAKKAGKPFWAFALSTAHTPYPVPTMAHLRLQMHSNLAYGAQLLQYFTYWNPGTETWNFHQAPIDQQGLRSRVYEEVRSLNQEIQRRAHVFVGCTVEDVRHMGRTVPPGTKPLEQLPPHFLRLDSRGEAALVSQIRNEGRHYVVIVNTSPSKPICMDIKTDSEVMRLRSDDTQVRADKYEEEYYLEPGAIEIFFY